MIGVKKQKLPLVKPFDIILYTLSTGFVLWVVSVIVYNKDLLILGLDNDYDNDR